jgi:hypothetical protein
MVVFEKRRALGGLRVANDQHFVPLEPSCTEAAATYKR